MNELNKKIESILEHSLPIMPDHQVERLTIELSKFFLEKMKEAYLSAWHNVISETGIEGLEDYLKSKYNINHHQER